MSMAHHAAGIGTCTQSGMTIPSFSSSEMHLGKFPDHTEFQSWIVNFRTEVCSKAENPTLALQWIKEIEAAKSLDDLITPKSRTGKDFPHYEELDMMATALKGNTLPKEDQCRGAESSNGQSISQRESNCLFDL